MAVEELDIPSDDAAIAAVRYVTELFRDNIGCNVNPLRLLQDRLASLDQGGDGEGENAVVSGDSASIRKTSVYLSAVDAQLLNVRKIDWRASKARDVVMSSSSSSNSPSKSNPKGEGVAALQALRDANKRRVAQTLSGELNMAVIELLITGCRLSAGNTTGG